jgi:hypothetical protein
MKAKSCVLALLLFVGLSQNIAQANESPKVESFTFTPNEVEVYSPNTKIDIELVVSHPSGIDNSSTIAVLSNSKGDTLSTFLNRIDSPINQSQIKVIFRGSIVIPSNITAGVYNLTSSGVKNNSSAGYQFDTGNIEAKKIRTLVGAEFGLLVKSNGSLNINYETIVGPAYDLTKISKFSDYKKVSSLPAPILKVGESIKLDDYFELKVPSLVLRAATESPSVCTLNNLNLNFISQGVCSIKLYTNQDLNYEKFQISQIFEIKAARTKPTLVINKIENTTASNLPRLITLTTVYSSVSGFVVPKSETPSVCTAAGTSVRITSGGTCTISYQTEESIDYLASDKYLITFEVTRDPQTITFTPSATANVSSKSVSLTASASGGGIITYSTTSAGVCSITGSTLNLLKAGNCSVTATQAGTATLAPASATASITLSGTAVAAKKTITCVKGKTTKKVTGTNPKCPTGYKLKK